MKGFSGLVLFVFIWSTVAAGSLALPKLATAGKPLSEGECRVCHGSDTAMRHMALTQNGEWGCLDCHGLTPERNCSICHDNRDCLGLSAGGDAGKGGGKKK